MEKPTEGVKKLGIMEIVHRRKDGSIVSAETLQNIITYTGMWTAAGLLLSDISENKFDWIAIGTGTTAATIADTALETESHREAAAGTLQYDAVECPNSGDSAGKPCVAQLQYTFSGYSGTESITEAGAFNAASSGDILNRQVFTAKNVDWTAGDTLQITIKIVNT